MNNDHIRPKWIPAAYSEGAKAGQADDIDASDAMPHPHRRKSILGAAQAAGGSIKKKVKSQRRALHARR